MIFFCLNCKWNIYSEFEAKIFPNTLSGERTTPDKFYVPFPIIKEKNVSFLKAFSPEKLRSRRGMDSTADANFICFLNELNFLLIFIIVHSSLLFLTFFQY